MATPSNPCCGRCCKPHRPCTLQPSCIATSSPATCWSWTTTALTAGSRLQTLDWQGKLYACSACLLAARPDLHAQQVDAVLTSPGTLHLTAHQAHHQHFRSSSRQTKQALPCSWPAQSRPTSMHMAMVPLVSRSVIHLQSSQTRPSSSLPARLTHSRPTQALTHTSHSCASQAGQQFAGCTSTP